MTEKLVNHDILFEVSDVFDRRIRTTKNYWNKITTLKHRELKYGASAVKETLKKPDEVRKSITDGTILLFSKKMKNHDILIVAVKILNGDGFLITCYQTKDYKQKGTVVWQKQKNQ